MKQIGIRVYTDEQVHEAVGNLITNVQSPTNIEEYWKVYVVPQASREDQADQSCSLTVKKNCAVYVIKAYRCWGVDPYSIGNLYIHTNNNTDDWVIDIVSNSAKTIKFQFVAVFRGTY